MKKNLIWFLAGAVLMFSEQSIAATTSLVGKKIDGQTTLKVDGKTVDQAIIVQGKSFVPVRSLTTAFGGEVKSVSKGGIELVTGIDLSNVDDKAYKLQVLEAAKAPLVRDRDQYIANLPNLEKDLSDLEADAAYAEKNNPSGYPAYAKGAENAKKLLEDVKGRIADLQAKIDAIDAQIAEVNAEPDSNG